MSVIGSNILAGASGNQGGAYNLTRSLRFRSSASAYLNRTPGSASNRKTFTWSGWVKRGKLSASQGIFEAVGSGGLAGKGTFFEFGSTNQLNVQLYDNTYNTVWNTTAVYRDPSAWYHVVLSVDTTQASPANMVKIYINGVQQSLTVTHYSATLPQNYDTFINNTNAHSFNSYVSSNYGDQYYAEVNFVDGQALTPSDFGETSATTGVWIPKAYTGSYGTNGFYLDFEDTTSTTTLGYDAAGSNDWTVNNISLTAGTTYDSMTDVPTLTSATAANYAVMNPLNKSSNMSLTNGNLYVNAPSLSWSSVMATMRPSVGAKYYIEFYPANNVSANNVMNVGLVAGGYVPTTSDPRAAFVVDFQNTGVNVGDVMSLAIDRVNNEVKAYTNNSLVSTTSISATAEYEIILGTYQTSCSCNFGQQPFSYTPPAGFVALNTFNLPTPTIGATASTQANKYMDAKLYTGTGSSLSVTGVGFQPDLTWIKGRSGATDHALYDAVRGVQLQLESNTTTDETTETTGLTAFGTDGFTVGALAQLNTSSATYVGWNWKESASSGFDIVTYTGNGSARTISHGLGVAPNMIIVKARTTASTDQGWAVYHSANTAAPETDYLLLNSTAATADLDTVWNDTAPTSSVFSVGTNALVNANNDTYVAYCFAEVAGYSKFGSYTGNGSADGPFIYTGFRPKYVMIKRSSGVESWIVKDSTRAPFNANNNANLFLNNSNAEDTYEHTVDFLSNGFKIRTTDYTAVINASGSTYVYACFAETPTKFANAR